MYTISTIHLFCVVALKIMTVCFESDLITDWPRIARTMRELGKRNEAANYLWDFLEFVVTQRTPLYILMQPFIFQKVCIKALYHLLLSATFETYISIMKNL